MPTLDTYRKQATLLVRWHREGNYSVGEKIRQIQRFKSLSDQEVLSMMLTLALAQEVIATEAGFANWGGT